MFASINSYQRFFVNDLYNLRENNASIQAVQSLSQNQKVTAVEQIQSVQHFYENDSSNFVVYDNLGRNNSVSGLGRSVNIFM